MNYITQYPRFLLLLLLLMAASLGIGLPSVVQAATITVNTNKTPIQNDGKCSLSEAIQNANNNSATHPDCVAGNASPTIDLIQFSLPAISSTITITGLPLPVITSSLSINGANNGNPVTISGQRLFQVFRVNGTAVVVSPTITIDTLKVTDGVTSLENGGAISSTKASLIVANSSFISNSAQSGGAIFATDYNFFNISNVDFDNNSASAPASSADGGALYASSFGALSITNSRFTNNVASAQTGEDANGGALYVASTSDVTITNANFVQNKAEAPDLPGILGTEEGGAIFSESNNLTITGSTFISNTANVNGGAIVAGSGGSSGASVEINNSTFTGNKTITGGSGGAINARNILLGLTNNTFTSNSTSGDGGAIGMGNLALGLTDNTFTSNIKGGDGGAIRKGNYALVLTNNTFTNNKAGNDGGAIDWFVDLLQIDNSRFVGNQAVNNGGAIYCYGASLEINRSAFISNQADEYGGAIKLFDCNLQIADNTFTNNMVDDNDSATDEDGGAIFIESDSTLEITNSRLTGNIASNDGGAIASKQSFVSIVDSELASNHAVNGDGGAIYNLSDSFSESRLDIVNSTLSGNVSNLGQGGAIFNVHGDGDGAFTRIRNSTIVDNHAGAQGGGLYNVSLGFDDLLASVEITNTILAGNLDGDSSVASDDCYNSPDFATSIITSTGFNLVGLNTSLGCSFTATGDRLIDPSLIFTQVLNPNLANNGGATQTHALLPGSPAIDNGGNCPPPTTDQRGVQRPMGARCDIGAYEAVQAAIVVTKTVGATPGVCATTAALTIDGGTNLYYCVTIRNSGNVTLTNAIVSDPALNISVTVPSLLAPGAVVALTSSNVSALGPVRAGDDLTNRVTVTATNPAVPIVGSVSATGVATATVVVIPVYSISLTPDNVTRPVGFTHSVTATVVDHQGRQASSIPVTFKVTGANPGGDNRTTDSDGHAFFAYIGTHNISASDTITASLGQTSIPILGRSAALSTVFLPLILNRGSTVIQGSATPFATVTVNWRKIKIRMDGTGAGTDAQATRTVTATVSTDDAAEQRIQGLGVGFIVAGPNATAELPKPTNAQGQAVFTYISKAPPANLVLASSTLATDTLTVWVDLNRDNSFDQTSEPQAVIGVVSAITLASFTAQVVDGKVNLAWQTAVEIDNAGFNLYRATASGGPYVKINSQLIGAQGNGTGASYSFVDTPPGPGSFFYKLEDVDYNGVSTMHGPIQPDMN